MIQAQFDKTFEGWREVAREYLRKNVGPSEIHWNDDVPSLLFEEPVTRAEKTPASPKVPAEFMEIAQAVAYARDEDRWNLLYRLLFRLQHENRDLLKILVDPDVHRVLMLKKSVRRDIHKMHAFVRFKEATRDGEPLYLAWHKPEHLIVRPAAPFFVRRFGDRRFSIFTPEESAHWDLKNLTYGPGMEQHEFDARDDWDEVWKTYYKSIFNPARLKLKAMRAEMSPKYWASMPETALIADLVREAPKRLQEMAANQNHAAHVAPNATLHDLSLEARLCTACPLHLRATQTVFGVGPENAEIMIVGEQPGDEEDKSGLPFVGPAGDILEQALASAGLKRETVYITNAVKHFKWTPRGKTRLHQKPNGSEMHACKPWLDAEIERVKPKVILALGATAATAILGRLPKISAERGRVIDNLKSAPVVIVSWHPAAILRAFDEADRQTKAAELGEDIRLAVSSR